MPSTSSILHRPNVVVSSLSRPTNGSGQTAYFTVYLTTQPTADVTVPINEKYSSKNSSNQQGTVDKNTLTFTSDNYATPQTVVVTGVDDYIFTGNVQYYIKVGAAASADTNYNTAKGPFYVTVNNNEIDVPGIVTSKTSGMATDTEGNLGSNYATFTICLKSKPTANVILNLTASPAYGSLNTSSLTFTPSNWNVPQTVAVTGTSAGAGHGGSTYSITSSISTTDSVYKSTTYVTAPSFSIFNCDNTSNAIAYCRLSGASTNTTQSGATAVFWLITRTDPASTPVSADVTSDNTPAGGTVSPATAVITTSNWKTLGSSTNRVVVTGSYNGDFINDVTYHVIFGSSTGGVSGYTVPQLTLINTHIALLTVTGVTTSTDQGATGSFTVKMNIQPSADVAFTVSAASYAAGVASSSGSVAAGTTDTLTFTNSNWNTPQTVYIKGDTYSGVRGDKTSTVSFGAISSGDSGMNGYTPPNANAVTCKEVNKLVWISNKTYVGNFNGGITQVDLDSTDTSDTNRPTGISSATYKALIADGVSRVATTDGLTDAGQTGWVLQAGITYYLYTGSLPTTTALFTTNSYRIPVSLYVPFTTNASDTFWTGLNSDWTTASNTCGQWKLDSTTGDYWMGNITDVSSIKKCGAICQHG